jgi:hypothetical protein
MIIVPIDPTIVADFDASCEKHGYNPEEFELSEEDEMPPPGIVAISTGIIRVRMGNIERIYSVGTPWIANFEADLLSGVFPSRVST